MQRMRTESVISSREFNQDVGRAKRAAQAGPVVITDRGKPAFVLMQHEDYRRLAGTLPKRNLFDLLAQDEPEADFDFDPPKLNIVLQVPEFD
jgi:prevent-host-death family protein